MDPVSAEMKTSHKATGDSTLQLNVTALPEGASVPKLTWTSSNEKVATVDENGLVTAHTYGKTTITAKTADGLSASCEIQTRYYDVDDSSSYWYRHVYWAADKGITKGYSSGEHKGKFGVGLKVTREDTVTFIYRMAEKPSYSTNKSFTDVKKGAYYYDAVLWAAQNGIANGYSSGPDAGKFGVGKNILRKDIVTFLSRYDSKFQ